MVALNVTYAAWHLRSDREGEPQARLFRWQPLNERSTQRSADMWGDMGHVWGWGMALGMISMVLFWTLVILGIIVLVKRVGGTSASAPRPQSALDILEERYARGEIGKEEFVEKKRDLSH